MAQDDEDLPPSEAEAEAEPLRPRRRRRRRLAAAALGLLLVSLLVTWFSRERIADNVISGQLAALDLPATYEIVSIGPRRQILRNVVVGDPRNPDLTIARVEISVGLGWGTPRIGRVMLTEPRLFGSYRNGRLSFGSLDPLIFTDSKAPFRLPDMAVEIIDGRALLDSDMGKVGVKLAGKGELRGGFAGELAAIAPSLALGDCQVDRVTLYGKISIASERPRFEGPLRLRGLDCPANGLRLADIGLQVDATADQRLDGGDGRLGMRSGALAFGATRLGSAAGTLRFTYRKRSLTARYALNGRAIDGPQAAASSARMAGVLRGSAGLARIETEGEIDAAGVRLGRDLDARLAAAQRSSEGTLAAPLLAQVRRALEREGSDSQLTSAFLLRRSADGLTLTVPQAALRGGSGQVLLSLSRFQFGQEGKSVPRLSGNFSTSGDGLPRIAGRMARGTNGQFALRATMAEYRADDARIALPALTLLQQRDGALRFAGQARLSGELPGGRADNLALPIEGDWSQSGGLAIWRDCVTVGFDRLALANLTFERRRLQLCPPRGVAIMRSDGAGTRIAAGVPSLDLAGRLGTTPIRIRSGAVGIAVPGSLAARSLDITLGPPATASRFRIANLQARVGDEVAGQFRGSDVMLAAVPLDLLDASGDWRFANGTLTLANGSFRVEDRQIDDRFQPLVTRGASLRLADNRITAEALLREPTSDREVVRATIRHDLGTGAGNAGLAVQGITFDQALQPDTLSRLALGVVANAAGIVHGTGRIDWNAKGVTSTGRFATDAFDFAAAFGPVKGASGTVVFTDLLGLVTAPRQELRIASINPGIEVNDGVLTYGLRPGNVLQIDGGSWPFLDGRLTLRPVTMNMGVAETRRYVLVIEGLNAARFVERMELANMSATGTFDGAIPLVFDENGGRLEGGLLTARAPGGNVSYVGALTYEDLSAMANFAFDALKSLDYREMTIGMDGALEGEIVTRVRFRGVSQGAGTKSNFLTKRVAKLPIQFNVNLRAPFLQLVSSFKSFYDPAFVRDPRELGLIGSDGRRLRLPAKPTAVRPAPIQP